jgi:phosphatidylserine decarboxylase
MQSAHSNRFCPKMVDSYRSWLDIKVRGRRNPFVAREGIPFILLALALAAYALRYLPWWTVIVPLAAAVLLVLLFRDPHRAVPSVALGIISPVDGEVVEVETTNQCVVQGDAYRVRIRIDALGTYSARSPIEGRVMDLHSAAEGVGPDCPANALWVQNDEGDNVVLQFHGYRFGLAPRAFVGFGERVGQGDRCAYTRLAEFAEVYLPIRGRVYAEPGQEVRAGTDLIGAVPHP